jgi:hypothetical protein
MEDGAMLFTVSHSAYSDADAKDVWSALVDINNWPAWDHKLAHTRVEGSAKPGSTYTMQPVGGNAKQIKIVRASDGVFQDTSKLDFGQIETERTVVPVDGGGCLITQTMRADVSPGAVKMFHQTFWQNYSQGMIDATNALAKEHARKTMVARHKNVA